MVMGKQGLSLTEVLVASALLGITTVASFKAADLHTRSRISHAQDESFMRMVRGIELILSTQSTCDANFAGQVLSNRDVTKLDRLDASLRSENSSTPFVLVQKTGGFTPGRNIPAGTGTSYENVRVDSLILKPVGESRQDSSLRRYSLELTARRPDTNAVLQRNFEVMLQHDLDGRDEPVQKCVLPEVTVIGVGVPDPGAILTACFAQMGGMPGYDHSQPDPFFCDITQTICRQLNLEYDWNTHKCNTAQIRNRFLMGMIGQGQCKRTRASDPSYNGQFDELLKGFAVDGSPLCAQDILATAPHIGKSLIPTPSRTAPPACSECWTDSPVDCRQYTDRFTSERAQGYRIFKHGVLFRTGCGSASIAGLPRCEMHPQAAVPCGPSPGPYPTPTTQCVATTPCAQQCCVNFPNAPGGPKYQLFSSGITNNQSFPGTCPGSIASCTQKQFVGTNCLVTPWTYVHPSCP